MFLAELDLIPSHKDVFNQRKLQFVGRASVMAYSWYYVQFKSSMLQLKCHHITQFILKMQAENMTFWFRFKKK